MHGPQVLAWVDAQLLVEHPADPAEHLQRLGLAAAAVQREHQLRPEPLPQRVVRGQPAQHRHELLVVAQRQLHVHVLLVQQHQHLGQPRRLVAVQRLRGHVRQRGPAPQRDRLRVRVPRAGEVARLRQLPRPRGARGEQVDVDPVQRNGKPVADRGRDDPRRVAEDLPQPHHVGLQRAARPGGRAVAPQRLDEVGDRDDLVGAQQQAGEQGAVLARPHGDHPVVPQDLHRSQQPELASRPHAHPLEFAAVPKPMRGADGRCHYGVSDTTERYGSLGTSRSGDRDANFIGSAEQRIRDPLGVGWLTSSRT